MAWVKLDDGSEVFFESSVLGQLAWCQRVAEMLGDDSCHYCRAPLCITLIVEFADDGRPRRHIPDGYRKGTIDHVVPVSKGGTWDMENLVLACGPCNSAKGKTPYEEFVARSWRCRA